MTPEEYARHYAAGKPIVLSWPKGYGKRRWAEAVQAELERLGWRVHVIERGKA